jgi:hypothetical protein
MPRPTKLTAPGSHTPSQGVWKVVSQLLALREELVHQGISRPERTIMIDGASAWWFLESSTRYV